MVVGNGIFYSFYYWSFCFDISSIVQSQNSKRLSSVKQLDKTCYADRHFINDIFLFLPMNKIILASQSPRRKQLLEWAEVPFEVVVQDSDEHFPPGLHPEEVA